MGDHNHFWAVSHISSYTYDTSTVALGNRVPHVPFFFGFFFGGGGFHDKTQPHKRKPSIFLSFLSLFFGREKAAGTPFKLIFFFIC